MTLSASILPYPCSIFTLCVLIVLTVCICYFVRSEQLMSREFETFRRAGATIGWRRPAISAETSPSWRGGVTLGGTWCQLTL